MSEEVHPFMAMLLAHNSFVGEAETVENEIMPLDEQLTFGIGDAAIVATADTPLECELTVARAVDPEKHAVTFPDWEDRLLNSYVLCELFSNPDREITLGWISRLKLLPITNYRYRQTRKWIKDGFPEHLPEWLMEHYRRYTDALSERSPSTVPRTVPCPYCHKREVELLVTRRIEYKCRVGTLQVEEKTLHVPIDDVQESDSHYARLHCRSCDATGDLNDNEWRLTGISN